MPPDFHVAVRNHFNAHLPGWSNDKASNVSTDMADKTTAFILMTSSCANAEKTKSVFPSELRSLPDLSLQIINSIPAFTTDTVQSLRPVGLSSKHLPCHTHSMYPVL